MNRPTFNLSSQIPLMFSLHLLPTTVVLGAVVLVVVKGQRLGAVVMLLANINYQELFLTKLFFSICEGLGMVCFC
ncbi:hypothetical protein Hanom_Chr06g00565641 [Helianthus anomalus]